MSYRKSSFEDFLKKETETKYVFQYKNVEQEFFMLSRNTRILDNEITRMVQMKMNKIIINKPINIEVKKEVDEKLSKMKLKRLY